MALSVTAWWAAAEHDGPLFVAAPGLGWDAGAAAADVAIDSGAAVLLLADATAPTADARAVGALLTGLDASRAIPTSLAPTPWMLQCAAVRDRIPTLRGAAHDPMHLATTDATLAHATALIVTAVRRRVPVVVSGPIPHIAAACAQRMEHGTVEWVQSAFDDEDPVAAAARTRLDARPWISSTVPLTDAQRIEMVQTILAQRYE